MQPRRPPPPAQETPFQPKRPWPVPAQPAAARAGRRLPARWVPGCRPPSQERARRLERESALSAPQPRRSAPHADSPGVGAEHALPPAHHAGVGALVDGVGDDAQVRLAQRQVAGVGELQGLLVLVPAAGRAEGWPGSRGRRPRPEAPGWGHSLHFALLVEDLLAAAEGHVPALGHQPGFGPGGRRRGGHRGEGELCSGRGGSVSAGPAPTPGPAPAPDDLTVAEVAAAGAQPLHEPPAGVTEAPPRPGRAHEQPVQAACGRAARP